MKEEGVRHAAGEVGCDIRSDEEDYGGDKRYGDAARFVTPSGSIIDDRLGVGHVVLEAAGKSRDDVGVSVGDESVVHVRFGFGGYGEGGYVDE